MTRRYFIEEIRKYKKPHFFVFHLIKFGPFTIPFKFYLGNTDWAYNFSTYEKALEMLLHKKGSSTITTVIHEVS